MTPVEITENFKIKISPKELMEKKLTINDLKDVIIFSFVVTKERYLSHSDFKFLLLRNTYKTIPKNINSEKKERWENWQKVFTVNIPGFIRWHPPFKQFDHETQLTRALDDLIKEGILLKDKLLKNYCISPSTYLKYYNIKTKDIQKIKLCDNFTIFNIDNLTFYGIVPLFDLNYDSSDKEICRELDSINKTVNMFIKKISELEKIFYILDVQQSILRAKVILNNIIKTKYKKKDKRLGFLYLNNYLENHKIKQPDFDWIEREKNSILKYNPENYELDKELSYKITSFLNAILDYLVKGKTIVFHPKNPPSQNIKRLSYNRTKEIKKKIPTIK